MKSAHKHPQREQYHPHQDNYPTELLLIQTLLFKDFQEHEQPQLVCMKIYLLIESIFLLIIAQSWIANV